MAICVIGYGKLGGRELGYGSDLDVVFLHDSAGDCQETTAAQDTGTLNSWKLELNVRMKD